MDPSIYREKWQKVRQSKADPDSLQELARQIAFSFIDRYFQSGSYVADYIDLLCEMATFHSKAELNNIGASALFEIVVEKLCDDFEELPIEVYSRVMCQIVSCCRTVPAGKSLDRQLCDFGITSCEQLYERALATHTRPCRYDVNKAPREIVLLSRVTLGADVAILSVMIQRLRQLFCEAGIILVGSRKLCGLFGGHPDVRIRELSYARRGGLFERFASWHAALEILRAVRNDGREEEILVIDPDSRVSQLGVLPLLDEKNYLFFNTRDHMLSASGKCMAEWTNDWMNAVFGAGDFCHPAIWTPPAFIKAARAKLAGLRAAGARRIVTMNLGVGQNPRKRLTLEFEKRLLRTLVAIPGTVVVLDRGFGADEIEHSAILTADVRACGYTAVETAFDARDFPKLSHGIVALECTIGQIAALIAESDEYIGYDSACQHIAAAARTPTLTVFAGSNNQNFVRRWSACGRTDCRIVHVNTLSDPQHVAVDEVIARIMQERTTRDRQVRRTRVQEMRTRRRPGAPAQEPTAT